MNVTASETPNHRHELNLNLLGDGKGGYEFIQIEKTAEELAVSNQPQVVGCSFAFFVVSFSFLWGNLMVYAGWWCMRGACVVQVRAGGRAGGVVC